MSRQQFVNPFQLELAAMLYDSIVRDESDVALYLELAKIYGGPILDLACGTGRCGIPLMRAGFDVVGIDTSEPMIEILKQKLSKEPEDVAHRGTPIMADIHDFSIPLRFGMAFIAANAFGQLLDKESQLLFLEHVYLHLRPGAALVLDLVNPLKGGTLGCEGRAARAGEYDVQDKIQALDAGQQTVDVRTTYHHREAKGSRRSKTAEIQWRFRYTFRFELEHLVERAGYEIEHVWGDYEKTPFGQADERILMVARKPKEEALPVLEIMRAEVPLAILP
jgi:SAM-dependent methyltransferase